MNWRAQLSNNSPQYKHNTFVPNNTSYLTVKLPDYQAALLNKSNTSDKKGICSSFTMQVYYAGLLA